MNTPYRLITPATHAQERLAARYLGTIRNPHKRTYGVKFWQWMTTDAQCPEPHESLSYMAAQAVRIRLTDILGGREEAA